ncbi:hypothetical protein PFAG_03509 [Plasmodium falciparum Santa Lucia]|uniref:Uncharacterized protein n=3 Tax=Plasmodium falciparum TaxID=5833 RepID=A0A024UWZ1_PLAFA|nr:hypothetical protein PFFVO_05587 [Plasmodium falciparum Vietnam Oak-Knoll (FVO)]ETW42177.1 hypothetical protein PFNF135_03675 [Plasmodium falciparum NF135/5.C10]EUT83634.1 hypothetical protein PFAG_03509 [Plasmodium falciparum Santa Lucia]
MYISVSICRYINEKKYISPFLYIIHYISYFLLYININIYTFLEFYMQKIIKYNTFLLKMSIFCYF